MDMGHERTESCCVLLSAVCCALLCAMHVLALCPLPWVGPCEALQGWGRGGTAVGPKIASHDWPGLSVLLGTQPRDDHQVCQHTRQRALNSVNSPPPCHCPYRGNCPSKGRCPSAG
jgi:hypothetical protein